MSNNDKKIKEKKPKQAIDRQARGWNCVLNNATKNGMTEKELAERIRNCNPRYFCMSKEVGEGGTEHIHFYLYVSSPIRFSTMRKRFPGSHIEPAAGTSQQNRDYIAKIGKWEGTDKAKTSILGTFYEEGEIPAERSRLQSKEFEMVQLLEMVKSGALAMDIIEAMPKYAMQVRNIDSLVSKVLRARFEVKPRDVYVTFVAGLSSKDRYELVLKEHPLKDICRITNYRSKKDMSFDGYNWQPVLVFDNFWGQIPLAELITYIDRYPVNLPARYEDKVAAYNYVYILSEVTANQLYMGEQKATPHIFEEFCEKIDRMIEVDADGVINERLFRKKEDVFYAEE